MTELLDAVDRLSKLRMLVVGDIILDRYSWGNADRVSPEAPVVVLKVDHHEVRLGGAASVAGLLRALGGDASLVGVIGNDSAGRAVSRLLSEAGIEARGVVSVNERPTTTKERLIGRAAQRHPFQVLRVDEEVTDLVGRDLETRLLEVVEQELASAHAVLISDYAKGVCTPTLLEALLGRCRSRAIPVIVDPARGVDCLQYRGATLLKPNRVEAGLAAGVVINSPAAAMQVAARLVQRFDVNSAVVTLDADGMAFATADGIADYVPTRPLEVYDITGAGDMTLAVLGLAIATGTPLSIAVALANVAAGLEVQRHGVAPVSRYELREALIPRALRAARKQVSLVDAAQLAERYRREGRRIVLTNGCFDLLHAGHVACLEEAASYGDVLIVAVNSDASARRLKGLNRPIHSETDRVRVLASLECVGHVLLFDGDTPHHVLEQIRPDVLVKGGTYDADEVVGREIVLRYGGQVRVTGAVPGQSTTAIVNRCQSFALRPNEAGAAAMRAGASRSTQLENS